MRYNLSGIHEMGHTEWNTLDATYSRVTRNGNNRNSRSGTHSDGTHDVERIESGTHTEWDTNRGYTHGVGHIWSGSHTE